MHICQFQRFGRVLHVPDDAARSGVVFAFWVKRREHRQVPGVFVVQVLHVMD
ncbi:hypothetical protein [Micromonospora maritima]|uniref:hypothetical protein n=1 Tax=Micromonospora maritima TaxID=986711 RepID=UPI003787D759